MNRRTFLAVVTSLPITIAGCVDGEEETPTPGAEDEQVTVEMTDDLVFVPDDLTIAAGDTVT